MAIPLSVDSVRFLRLRGQRLAPQHASAGDSVARVVKGVCGVQAQDALAAALAVRVRSIGLVAADVERARVEERSVVSTWGLRGTLHLLATEDLFWLRPLLGPIFVYRDRRRRAELGLDEDTCTRGMQVLRALLGRQGPQTRAEIVEYLRTQGIQLEGQAVPHLLSRAALEGLLCLGPDRHGKPTYVLVDDWLGREHTVSLPREAASAELARRYLAAYGPAGPEDLAAWSGLPLTEVRASWARLASELLEVQIASRPAWMLRTRAAWLDKPPSESPPVRLLPAFDTYLLGYRSRDLILDPPYARRVNAGGGMVRPTVLAGGRVVATWKSLRKNKHLEVIVQPFEELAPELNMGVAAEEKDLARFLGLFVGRSSARCSAMQC